MVFDIVGQPALVSRESARRVKPALRQAAADGAESLRLNFSGARGVAPSFLDEALLVAEECIAESNNDDGEAGATDLAVIFANPPTALAAKHHAIARAHGLTLRQTESGDWEFRVAHER